MCFIINIKAEQVMNKRKAMGAAYVLPSSNKQTKILSKQHCTNNRQPILNEKLYSVNESECIYICQNATNKEHECDFGICEPCYLKNAPTRSSRKRKQDVDDSICNHSCISSLQQFFDDQYFEKDYIANCKKRNIAWTTKCAQCNARFVSMTRNGKVK